MLKKQGSVKKGVNDSHIVLNHLRFVVYTVDIDRTTNESDSKKKISLADKLTISHIEVIPKRWALCLLQHQTEKKR